MTRSIGDFDLKNMGVIAEPETKRVSVGLNKLTHLSNVCFWLIYIGITHYIICVSISELQIHNKLVVYSQY